MYIMMCTKISNSEALQSDKKGTENGSFDSLILICIQLINIGIFNIPKILDIWNLFKEKSISAQVFLLSS